MMAPASSNEGSYTWRGGNKILLEKMDDRFTVMPGDSRQLERVRSATAAQAVEPVTNQVVRIETASTQRDGMMERLRSPTFRAIVHHAYRPAGSDGTIYYLTDRILVSFKRQVKSADIDAILTKHALRLLKVYAFRHNTFLVQVTDSSGANPIKIANRLAEEPDVRTAEPNTVSYTHLTLPTSALV